MTNQERLEQIQALMSYIDWYYVHKSEGVEVFTEEVLGNIKTKLAANMELLAVI